MTNATTFCATEELWRLAKSIMAFVECDAGQCADCDLLRSVAADVLGIKKKMQGVDD